MGGEAFRGQMGEGRCLNDVGPEGTSIGSEQLLQLFCIPCYLQGVTAASDLNVTSAGVEVKLRWGGLPRPLLRERSSPLLPLQGCSPGPQ